MDINLLIIQENNLPFLFQRSYNISLNVVLVSQPHILSDTAVGKIGRFCLFFFLQNLSFILFGVVWKGFTPSK